MALSLVAMHFLLEGIYIYAGCSVLAHVNLISMAWYGSICFFYEKLTRTTCFWMVYFEIIVLTVFAITLYGDHSCYSINLLPVIALVCQWDYENKHVLREKDKKDKVYIGAISFVVLIYLCLQTTDFFDFHMAYPISPYMQNVICYVNFIAVIVATLISNSTWLVLVSDSAGQLENTLERTDYIAKHDTLTGLKNRKSLEEFIDRLTEQGVEYAMIMGDIDHFKRINDNYGHDCGDYVLVQLGRMMRQNMRKNDRVYRWGGEEVIVILPQVDGQTAAQRAEVIRRKIEAFCFKYKEQQIEVTVTFGVTVSQGRDFVDVMTEADGYLYSGKEQGRNCVIGQREYSKNKGAIRDEKE